MQQVECFVVLHFQDMRVSTNEQLRWRSKKQAAYLWGVIARIAADMRQQYIADRLGLYIGIHTAYAITMECNGKSIKKELYRSDVTIPAGLRCV